MCGPAKAQALHKIDQHNFIAVKIKHFGLKALIETGAFYSCVSLALIKRLKLESQIIPTSHQKRLFTADGKAMHVLGTIQLTLDIQEFQIPLTFCVLPRLQFDIMLVFIVYDKRRPMSICSHKFCRFMVTWWGKIC